MDSIKRLFEQAVAAQQVGQSARAEELLGSLLRKNSRHADAHHLLGILLYQRGQHALSAESIRKAIEITDDKPAFHCNLCLPLQALKCFDEAIASARRALTINPKHPDAYNNLGTVAQLQQKLPMAIEYYSKAIELCPEKAIYYANLGLVYYESHQLDDAKRMFTRATELDPRNYIAIKFLGVVCNDEREPDRALAYLQRARDIAPNDYDLHARFAHVYVNLGRLIEAEASAHLSLQIQPGNQDALINLAAALHHQGRFDESLDALNRVLREKPNCVATRFNRSTLLLTLGDFDNGWLEYEWRWLRKDTSRPVVPRPMWHGEAVPGKTVMLFDEQGLGDTLQFIRYGRELRRFCERVMLVCHKPLVPLLQNVDFLDKVVQKSNKLPPFDYYAPLMSLPGLFKTNFDNMPNQVPYIHADEQRILRWQSKVREGGELQIGIAWQGNRDYIMDRLRSIPLEQFAPLTTCPGVRLISLQKGDGLEQMDQFRDRVPVTSLDDAFDDALDVEGAFTDTAAVMMSLDLVITSDSAVAHLAGAMGVPVWVALPFVADWRFFLHRDDSPWYPTMRLFRQEKRGGWAEVFARIAEQLNGVIQGRTKLIDCRAPRHRPPAFPLTQEDQLMFEASSEAT